MTTQAAPEHVPHSQTDVVVHGIKRMIIAGLLGAGGRLPIEKDLAAELGVSRGSLREGVRALCIMGVLETRQGDGTYVTSLDSSLLLAPMGFLVDLQTPQGSVHLQSVRRVLESEAAAQAARHIDAAAVAEAEAILSNVEPMLAGSEVNHDAIMDADIAFHRVIARASGNPALEALIEALASRTARGRMWRAITEDGAELSTHAEHRAVLTAVAAHDPDTARLRMGVHLLAVEDFLRSQTETDSPAVGTPTAAAERQ